MEISFEEFSKSASNYGELIETLETLLISEKLLGVDITINKHSDFWTIDISSFDGKFYVPLVCSEFYPPSIVLQTDILEKNIDNVVEFLVEIKHQGIIVQHLKSRNMGYVNLGGGNVNRQPSRIQFLFPKHDTLINFYNLYKKHGI